MGDLEVLAAINFQQDNDQNDQVYEINLDCCHFETFTEAIQQKLEFSFDDLKDLIDIQSLIQLDLTETNFFYMENYRKQIFELIPQVQILDNLNRSDEQVQYGHEFVNLDQQQQQQQGYSQEQYQQLIQFQQGIYGNQQADQGAQQNQQQFQPQVSQNDQQQFDPNLYKEQYQDQFQEVDQQQYDNVQTNDNLQNDGQDLLQQNEEQDDIFLNTEDDLQKKVKM